MSLRHSLKYKLLHLVLIQMAFFSLLMAVLWLINPHWLSWHQYQPTASTELIKDFKHHYGMLSTLNVQLSKSTADNSATTAFHETQQALITQSRAVQQLCQEGQQAFHVDFSVLMSFLFHYQNKLTHLTGDAAADKDALLDLNLYFSRIQSEFFYIVEEIGREESAQMADALKRLQTTLMIWIGASLITLLLSTIIALNYAHAWHHQIAALLQQAYRLSSGHYSESTVYSQDELGQVAKAFSEAIGTLQEREPVLGSACDLYKTGSIKP
jgi:methyl-accepting chemotaxis protein